MCYQYNAPADIAAVPCPMCKVFKPSAARYPVCPLSLAVLIPFSHRCPHLRDVCYNRANHPRIDVVHLKNAEGPSVRPSPHPSRPHTPPQ